jgi:hypothetical protein
LLHYAIPQQGFDCQSTSGTGDLPPGQYAVPFKITIHNLIGQQSPAIGPLVWGTDGSPSMTVMGPSNQIQVTGNAGSARTYDNGSCESAGGVALDAFGSMSLYGFVGPASVTELRRFILFGNVDGKTDPSSSLFSKPTTSVVPNGWWPPA